MTYVSMETRQFSLYWGRQVPSDKVFCYCKHRPPCDEFPSVFVPSDALTKFLTQFQVSEGTVFSSQNKFLMIFLGSNDAYMVLETHVMEKILRNDYSLLQSLFSACALWLAKCWSGRMSICQNKINKKIKQKKIKENEKMKND